MADKGFALKILVPTDDGLHVSENGIENPRYYLVYNISNRSYQLAGKVKCADFFENIFSFDKLKELVVDEKIDLVVSNHTLEKDIPHEIAKIQEINQLLNWFIDQIDQKKR